ncbi:MAG: DCC1-like thiol-disulfide oxidoreductase family protein [Oculatellaceae cyanobacterium bins.114]|nr:DCC1-like thiol-disulfide oxidoreductase family protein [Oculatellaceae cyanobacterium bins.114]
MYHVVYDGDCNLCVNLVRLLETLDRGERFQYTPMQDQATLDRLGVTSQACEQGMILINADKPDQRWQGSAAAEEIGRLFPAADLAIAAYRAVPGLKPGGDRFYEFIRDNRYALFGRRTTTYQPTYPICAGCCASNSSPLEP